MWLSPVRHFHQDLVNKAIESAMKPRQVELCVPGDRIRPEVTSRSQNEDVLITELILKGTSDKCFTQVPKPDSPRGDGRNRKTRRSWLASATPGCSGSSGSLAKQPESTRHSVTVTGAVSWVQAADCSASGRGESAVFQRRGWHKGKSLSMWPQKARIKVRQRQRYCLNKNQFLQHQS